MRSTIAIEGVIWNIGTNEILQPINLNDFFNVKYQNYNNRKGIQGLGIITPRHSIHVLNLSLTNTQTGKRFPGIADHETTQDVLLTRLFGIDTTNTDLKERVVRIRYRNQVESDGVERREAIMEMPAYLNKFQSEQLKKICNTILQIEDVRIGGIIYAVDPRKDYKNGNFIIQNRPWEMRFGYDEIDGADDEEEIKLMLDQLDSDIKEYYGYDGYTERNLTQIQKGTEPYL